MKDLPDWYNFEEWVGRVAQQILFSSQGQVYSGKYIMDSANEGSPSIAHSAPFTFDFLTFTHNYLKQTLA